MRRWNSLFHYDLKGFLSDKTLGDFWQSINWEAAAQELAQLQREIALAAKRRDIGAAIVAQNKLVSSADAKVLAVKHVCDSVTHPGIDGIAWETDAQKMDAALSLNPDGYKASPMRMIVIQPRGTFKKRHIQIPTFYDRAMQALHAYTLDPVAESLGERKSFAFRKGRSMFDVHAHILQAFDVEDPPKFLIKADIKSYYATISHRWLLANIPMNTQVLKEFLKAGHVFGGELFPAEDFGISLGSSLSPILGNMVLDGAQEAIFKGLHGRDFDIDFSDGNLIRFADDLLITARTQRSANRIIKILRSFLNERGLSLSEAKTKVLSLSSGFDFLSRHYYLEDGNVCSTPSKNAVIRFEQSLIDLIRPYRGGQKALIDKLNRKLIGWANYHKVTKAESIFRNIDNLVKALLLELCEKLHPRSKRKTVIKNYFVQDTDGEYIYALKNKPDVRVQRIANTVLYHHQPVSTRKNPYLESEYFDERADERAISTATGKYKAVWLRQEGRCYYCGRSILVDEEKRIVTFDPASRQHSQTNLAYVHAYCCAGSVEFYADDWIDTRFDLHELLLRLKARVEPPLNKDSIFTALAEFFKTKREAAFTLSFQEIENILGRKLCNTAKTRSSYWYTVGESRISHCWLSYGYKIRRVNFEKKAVSFQRFEDMGEVIEIPPVFLSGRIPPRAKAEIELMLKDIKKKYGL